MGLLKLNIQYFAEGTVTIAMDLDTKRFDEEIKSTERKLNDMVADYETLSKSKGFNEQSNDAIMLRQNIEKLNNKLVDLKKKQDDVGKSDMSQIPTQLSTIGSSMEGIIKKVTRWGLAIFGIRSAYNFIRGSISTLSGYNEQISTDVEYIRYSIATMLQPVIETIIKLAYKLLTYTAYIAKAWFGVNIFANATAKSFQDTNKAVKNTNKSAKELQKTLAGFDEMNILQQDGSTTLGGGGGGVTVPSVDLSNWENVEIPKWIKWIADNKNTVLSFFADLVATIATIKIASFLIHLTGIFNILSGMSGLPLFAMLGGIAVTVLGIYQTIRGLIDFIANPTWENFSKVLSGLETVLIGVGIAMVALNASNPIGWISILVGAVGGLVNQLFKEEKQAYSTKEAEEKLKESRQKLAEVTDEYVRAVDNAEQTEKNLKEAQDKTGISINDLLKQMKAEHKDYQALNSQQREVYKAYLANEEAQKKLKNSSKELKSATKEETKYSLEKQLALAKETENYDNLKKAIIKTYKETPESVKEAREVIFKALDGMSEDAQKTFVEDIPEDIMKAFNPEQYSGTWNSFEYWWNRKINSLNKNIRIGIDVASFGSGYGGGGYRAKGGIYYPSKLPKLAVGGIINQPGRGVPYHGAIIGERGAEAVVPLTDSQQMALLGKTIGEYITINATITNTMNGRIISRELQKVQSDSDFAYNR